MVDAKTLELQRAKMTRILDELGIELGIYGCGCNGSPEVTFKYKGEEIIDAEDNFVFNNIKYNDIAKK